jgi:hypothetical protein
MHRYRGRLAPAAADVIRSGVTKALQLAIAKAAALPEAAQEELGRELLERIERLNELRAAIDMGARELDAGLGEELDIERLIGELHQEDAGRT